MAAAPANRRRAVSRVEWQSSLSVVGSWMDLVHEGRTKEEEDQFARRGPAFVLLRLSVVLGRSPFWSVVRCIDGDHAAIWKDREGNGSKRRSVNASAREPKV